MSLNVNLERYVSNKFRCNYCGTIEDAEGIEWHFDNVCLRKQGICRDQWHSTPHCYQLAKQEGWCCACKGNDYNLFCNSCKTFFESEKENLVSN